MLPSALIHLALEHDDGGVTAPKRRGLPTSRTEQDQRVEHLRVETGGMDQRGVAALDRMGEPIAQRWIFLDVALQVGKSERDVASFVLRGETGDLTRAWI